MDHKLWVIFGPFTLLYELMQCRIHTLRCEGGGGGRGAGPSPGSATGMVALLLVVAPTSPPKKIIDEHPIQGRESHYIPPLGGWIKGADRHALGYLIVRF